MDAESLTLLIISLSEVASWDSVLTTKGPVTQPQAPERWVRSLSSVRRGTEPPEPWGRTEAQSLPRDPRSPHSGDKGDADGGGRLQQMVSIQGAAAEMLTSGNMPGALTPVMTLFPVPGGLARIPGRSEHYLLSRFTGLYASQ